MSHCIALLADSKAPIGGEKISKDKEGLLVDGSGAPRKEHRAFMEG